MSALVRSAAVAVAAVALAAPAAFAAPTVTEYGEGSITNNAAATGFTVGPDGNMYLSEFGLAGNRLARVTPDGTVTELPQFSGISRGVQNLVTGPDGRLYLTEASVQSIGVFDIAHPDTLDEHATPTTPSEPHEITVGPDGNIWFSEASANLIGEFSTSDPSTIHEFPTGGLGASAQPYGLTAGPDGALWFTERGGNQIDRLDTADPQNIQHFNSGLSTASRPRMIAVGSDGRLWFTQQNTSEIGAIDPVTHVIQEFSTPTFNANPIGIALGPDGAMWFTENFGGDTQKGAIGRITPDGAITEYPLTPRDGESVTGVWNIIQGPDGNMWFTEIIDERVGRITTPPTATTGAASAVGSASATINGTVDGHAQATSFHVDYGTTPAYGATTPEQSLGTITGAHSVAAALGGLSPSKTYHYRVVATNTTASAFGADATFTTAATPPVATPAISRLRVGKRWRLGSKLPRFSRNVPTGTTIRFVLSEAARVKLRFVRQVRGRRSGKRAGTLSFSGHAGANSVRFQGRLSRRKALKPGRYKLIMTATAGGKTSRPRSATFTVLPRKG